MVRSKLFSTTGWLSFCLALFAVASPSTAEPRSKVISKEQTNEVTLRVRAIRAHGVMLKKVKTAEDRKGARTKPQYLDQELADLESKLRALPYRTYRLITSREVVLPVMKQQTVRLQGGQTLNLRLLYADRARIGMWLNWLNKAGSTLLDTRVHFNRGEVMLTGTESSSKCGMLLSLEVLSK
ncbi:MAG: hypothetical protein GX589_04745 [Deltaproteobacteria bacterium]|nr:hypothetical protein [Deltaproteobacteria bacterium]